MKCQACHKTKHLLKSSRRVNKDGKIVQYYRCKVCQATRMSAYRANLRLQTA